METTRGFAANLLIPRHGILMNTDCSGRVLHAPDDAIILFLSQIISVDTYFIFFDIFHNFHVFGVRFSLQSDAMNIKCVMNVGSAGQ